MPLSGADLVQACSSADIVGVDGNYRPNNFRGAWQLGDGTLEQGWVDLVESEGSGRSDMVAMPEHVSASR